MEYRRKCNVCGKIYCYTDSDLSNNDVNAIVSNFSALGAVASLFGGTRLDTYALNAQADRYNSKIIDFNKCPDCGSLDTVLLTDEEWHTIQKQATYTPAKGIDINSNATPEALLKRATLFLEDSEWGMANAYCDQVLDVDPENAMAYIGKLMAELHVHNISELLSYETPFSTSENYLKAVRFADAETKAELERYSCVRTYNEGLSIMKKASSESEYLTAISLFEQIKGFEHTEELIAKCQSEAEIAHKNAIYESAKELLEHGNVADCENAIRKFESILGWKDSEDQIQNCRSQIASAKSWKIKKLFIFVVLFFIAVALCVRTSIQNNKRAEIIAENFSGTTFTYSSAYINSTYQFSSNQTVYTTLKYRNSYDGDWKTNGSSPYNYTVSVSLFGKISLKVTLDETSSNNFIVIVDEFDRPTSFSYKDSVYDKK